jgi:hypothetical protein
MNYFQKQEAMVKVDPEKFTIVDSEKELVDKFAPHIEGYKLATEYDLVKEFDKEYPIIELNRTLRIEKAWYMMDRLFVVYSFDLKNGDKDPKDIPSLTVKNLTFNTSDGGTEKLAARNGEYNRGGFNDIEKGFVLNNRIYKGQVLFANETYEKLFQKLMDGEEIETIVLNNLTLKEEQPNGNEIAMKDIALDLNFNFLESQILDEIAIDKEVKLVNGDRIKLTKFQLGIYNNAVYFSADTSNKSIRNFDVDVAFPSDMELSEEMKDYFSRSFHITYDQEGKRLLYIPGFEEIPEYITLNFKAAEYTGTEIIEFTITEQELKSFLTSSTEQWDYERLVGKTKDFEFVFAGISHTDLNGPENMSIKIGVNTLNKQNKLVDMYFTQHQEYEESLKRAEEFADKDPYAKYWLETVGPIIKITNDKNEELLTHGNYVDGDGSSQYQSIILDEDAIRSAKELHVKIFKIPQMVEFMDKEAIKIKIK